MSTRIRSQLGRPWIKRPRQIAAVFAVALAFSASTAYAQRCAGVSGGTGGSSGSGSLGVAGGVGGIGRGQFGPMMAGQGMGGMQGTQGLFLIPSMPGDIEPEFDHRAYLQQRKDFRLAQAELRKKRVALRGEKQSKLTANRNKNRSGT